MTYDVLRYQVSGYPCRLVDTRRHNHPCYCTPAARAGAVGSWDELSNLPEPETPAIGTVYGERLKLTAAEPLAGGSMFLLRFHCLDCELDEEDYADAGDVAAHMALCAEVHGDACHG